MNNETGIEDLDLPRPVARSTDPDTSHAAADSVSDETIRTSYMRILGVLNNEDRTDEEIAQILQGWPTLSGLRTRRCEMVRLGLVTWSGEKRTLKSGRKARVWAITDLGRQILSYAAKYASANQ